MNDLCRQKLDKEIERLNDKLKTLDPATESYKAVSTEVTRLTELVTKDDEIRNKFVIEKEKLDAEASLEAAKRGIESEKLELETEKIKLQNELETEKLKLQNELEISKHTCEVERQAAENRRTIWQIVGTGVVTLATFFVTGGFNMISQQRAEYFESTGHAYTSRFQRWRNKDPNHPSPIIKK